MLFGDDPPSQKLAGIAKLAAESDLLAAKRETEYLEISARSILNRTKPGMPFAWTINPYRGCEFGCHYCYARYTHEFMGMENGRDFEEKIFAKKASADLLRRELRKISRDDGIAIGTATDPYQPAERRFERTRAILAVFAKQRGWRLGITTKSNLIARDLDLLTEIRRGNILDVNITVTTLDARLARLLEPRAPRPDLRLEALRSLSAAGIYAGVFPNPVMPGITDSDESLDAVARAVKEAGGRWFGGGPLFLMPSAAKVFLPFLDREFPHLAAEYRRLYAHSPFLGPAYKEKLRARVNAIRERHGLAAAPVEYRPEEWQESGQLALFPLQ
jgi:DNA repair photolyase